MSLMHQKDDFYYPNLKAIQRLYYHSLEKTIRQKEILCK